MQNRPATLTLCLLSGLLLIAWLGTLVLPAQAYGAQLRWSIALIGLPTWVGYGLYFLRERHLIRIELSTMSRYASWLVMGAAALIILNELGLLEGSVIALRPLVQGGWKLLLSLLFWAVFLILFFKRTGALTRDSGDRVLALLYVVVIGVHNFPEGLALGMSLPRVSDSSADAGLVMALAIQNVVDAVIAGAVLLPRRIGVGRKVLYLLALPVLEVLSAALVLNDALMITALGNGILIFAASGMVAIAVSDSVMSRRPVPAKETGHSETS